ncbi:unnamed protein product, partial [Adineta steineri]
MHQRWAR